MKKAIAASTVRPSSPEPGSAYAYMVAGKCLTQPTNKPPPELVEGKGGVAMQDQQLECADSREFDKSRDC